jgi:hypothetical protein
MSRSQKLLCIKIVHTAVWIFYVIMIGYILYAGISDKIDFYVFAAIGLVIAEGLILLIFKWKCPLTVLACKYTDNRDAAFDIFLPGWLAKNNKTICTALFAAGLLMIVYRMMSA